MPSGDTFMAIYRLFFFDALNHIWGAEILNCVSDDEALKAAQPFTSAGDLEVWDHSRLVARLPGTPVRPLEPSSPTKSAPLAPEGAHRFEPGAAPGGARLDTADQRLADRPDAGKLENVALQTF